MPKKLTKKQEDFLNLLLKCYKENNEFPSLNYLKKISQYKSYNSIYKYLNQLEMKGYLKKDSQSKKITFILNSLENNETISIPIINEHSYLKVCKDNLKKNISYLAYKIHDSKLAMDNVFVKDILIIEKQTKKLENKLVLVFFDNEYRVFKYLKQAGFIHLVNNREDYVLTDSIMLIGKVVSLIRPLSL